MMTSTTTLAIGTSAGTLLLTATSALVMGLFAGLSHRHQRQFFAWTRKIRRKDETNTEYDKPSAWLAGLYEAQCGLAQKPCVAEDFKDIATIGTMLAGIADHTEGVRFELAKVVESVRGYVATALPAPGQAVRIGLPEHRARLEQAMRQEAARDELAHAVLAAQKKIKELRHS
ncbi:hypothetical protein [Streptomyces sp. N50]|uniref:hypothetical protein n=1 Tax=Streptomyces sp. N50 TaxID=3081765 RepID=UPI0029622D06|nr:hypothetical protein [Streptomyces sp. N50]WOX10345.1 hypothetical protein R2B38_16490 [Streptomyces sp. N50]